GVPSIVIISYADYESHASIPKIDSKARISAEKEPSLVEALLSCPCDISDLIEDRTGYDLPSAFDKEECFVAEGQA
ncbi:MAG: hypothetical protein IKS92_03570, partial [Victivallales bacterium]|nr:hypothetical protein [Victivallales bacterium]